MTLLAAAVAILVGWSSTGQSVYFPTVPLTETFASPEWATMMRSRNARALAERRLVEAERAAVVLEPPAAEVPVAGGLDLDPPAPGAGTIVWRPKVERWRTLVDRYFTGHGESEHALAIVRCESVGDPNAVNDDARDPAEWVYGLFQHKIKYWPGRSAKAGWAGADILDPEANVAVAAWLVHEEGWGHFACEWYAEAQGVG